MQSMQRVNVVESLDVSVSLGVHFDCATFGGLGFLCFGAEGLEKGTGFLAMSF